MSNTVRQSEAVVVINPISGRREKGAIRKERVDAFIQQRGLDVVSVMTEYAGHASEIAREAVDAGVKKVISVGGDGTINEVAKELVGTGIEFGLVPMGSGNGLARHLGLPLKFESALAIAVKEDAEPIDTGFANGHAFFNVMGLGFDAEIGKRFNGTHTRGFMSYLKIGFNAFKTYESKKYTIHMGEDRREIEAYFVTVANSSQYGNNAYIAPDARVNDGILDLISVKYPGVLGALALAGRLFTKRTYGSPFVKVLRSSKFTIELEQPGFFHADGEIFECDKTIDIRVEPNSLLVAGA